MKKNLIFIPLGLGISAAILYIYNIIIYKVNNSSYTMLEILSDLRVYLYVSIAGFLIYFFIRAIILLNKKEREIDSLRNKDIIVGKAIDEVVEEVAEEKEKKVKVVTIPEVKKEVRTEVKEVILTGNKYCSNCGEKIFDIDNYCKSCGTYQKDKKSGHSALFNKIIYIVKVVILILILYFLINMMFDYKEKHDPTFKSPFKVQITK